MVAFDIEDDPLISEKVSAGESVLDVLWRLPIAPFRFGKPGFKRFA